jgi:membrane-associated protein
MFDAVNEFIQAHAGAPWVLLVVAGLCFIDGIIPPLPSESVVVALAAVGAAVGEPHLVLLGAVAAVGAFAGDQTAYTIGRHSPLRRVADSDRPRVQRAMARARTELGRRGAMIIIAARYIPVGRIAVNFTAGALRYPRPKFVLFDAIAATSWAAYSVALGALAGSWLEDNPLLGAAVAVTLAIVLGALLDRLIQRWSRPDDPAATSADAENSPNSEKPLTNS